MSELDLSFSDYDPQRRLEQETARGLSNSAVKGLDLDDVITFAKGLIFSPSSSTQLALIGPPNTDDDWEIHRIFILEVNSIDVADRVIAQYQEPSVIPSPTVNLATGTFGAAAIGPQGQNFWNWPNSGATNTLANSQDQEKPIVTRRLDATTLKLAVSLWVITTATVGSRSYTIHLQIRKRKR